MKYCIVTEWDDGTVGVTQIVGLAGVRAANPPRRVLDDACRRVALEVEGDKDESRVHAVARGTGDTSLPHYYVGSVEEIAHGTPAAECYVLKTGVVTVTA